jgi:hypothetical protein
MALTKTKAYYAPDLIDRFVQLTMGPVYRINFMVVWVEGHANDRNCARRVLNA